MYLTWIIGRSFLDKFYNLGTEGLVLGEGVSVVLVNAEIVLGPYYAPGEVVRGLSDIFRGGDDFFHLCPFRVQSIAPRFSKAGLILVR